MTSFDYNSRYLIKDQKPWFPVMGELHYSRYREDFWEESLRKMKAGGVSIVSTYVIWIHHEEEEGCFDFTGCRDLGRFLQLCKKVGIYVFLRLGPWVHGEVRNGGFPDWLLKKDMTLRSDDPGYLAYVKRFWQQAYRHAEGMMRKDGGPVIGVQIENEYGHVGGQTGEAGEQHMRTLTAMAKELGFVVPLYTATGWGGACTGGLLPVMGGYCEAPWDQRVTELEANPNYVFSHIRNDALIACDHHVEEAVTFNEADFPFLTAELGGGVQVTKHRRPVAEGRDIGAMSVAKLGSGVALLGYYMYHGGSNPKGKLSTLQESKATGYLNDLPEINYDFNAPIRQYGQISDNYREIRMLAYFLQDFGSILAALPADIEPDGVMPEDLTTLRLSCRHDENRGFLFFNNYQRRREMPEHRDVELIGKREAGDVHFPAVTIASGQYGFFPYGMKLDEAVLKSALAVPLCRLETEQGHVFVFYGDWEPQFEWEGKERAKVLHIGRALAKNACRVHLDQDYLIFSEGFVWEEDGKLKITGGSHTVIRSYPELKEVPGGFQACGQEGELWRYERLIDEKPGCAELVLTEETGETAVYEVKISYGEPGGSRKDGRDTWLVSDYAGESLEVYMDGEKIEDHFYTGQEVWISLGYFDFPKELRIVVHALHQNDSIFLEKRPEMKAGRACRINGIRVEEEYE